MNTALSKISLSILLAFACLGVLASEAAAQKWKGRYKVRIDSAPQQAAIYIENESAGIVAYTPWEGRMNRGTWKIIIKKDGYEPLERTITVARTSRLQEVFVPLVKKEEPAKIDVRADADKNAFNAQVWFDGQAQGQVPVILTAKDGRHLIEIKKEGFETFTQWVDVKEGDRITVNPVLKQIEVAKKGSILVEADVSGAEVYIDGNRHTDVTPTLITDVLEGPHIIEVRKEPAIPWKQTINVVHNQTVKVSAALKASMAPPGGTVRVLSNVEGARVFIDGTDMGPAPLDVKDVKPGDHVVEVKAEGYMTREERITVNAGSASVLKLDLQPLAAQRQVTKLTVVSPVPEAIVFVDGERLGLVPQEKELAPGEHFVVVTKQGYKKFEQKVNVAPGQAMTVSAELPEVGSVRALSTPSGAQVFIDGMEAGVTPFNRDDIDVGEHVVTVRMAGHYDYEKRINVEGGKRTIITARLEEIETGPTADELEREQRGLSSFGARAMPLGRSTVDMALGYPYYLDSQITVGAGKMGGFGFDAGVFLRTALMRTELGAKARLTLADKEPFSLAIFTQLGGGSAFIDDSQRNTFFANVGLLGSLSAFGNLTVTGRAYLDLWSDRHCPAPDATGAEPIEVCPSEGELTAEQMEDLTALELDRNELTERETGARVMLSAIAEIAIRQRWSVWVLFEGAPFQTGRAAHTNLFNNLLPFGKDTNTYLRIGGTYKF